MRNFLLFLRRFSNLLLFIGLEVVCLILIVRTRSVQGYDILSSSNAVAGFFYNRQNAVATYFSLREANNTLVAENAALRAELSRLKFSTDTLRDSAATQALPRPREDSAKVVQYAKYTYRQARVIQNSVTEKNNYLTLNRGSEYGIRKNMSVITSNGVVGKVVNVSAHYATVLSVLSDQQRISARFKDSTSGQVQWRGRSPEELVMYNVPPDIPMLRGDTVWTSAYSAFPPDVMIGVIFNVLKDTKTGQRIVFIRPSANFRAIQYVYVVDNEMLPERRALEDQPAN